jgi:hypothetical protein
MPLFYFTCKDCKKTFTQILNWVGGTPLRRCECGGELGHSPKAPSTQTKEVLDNGIMNRRLERFAEAEDLHRDHADSVKDKPDED